MTRRKLLLWGVPAVLGLAVIGLLVLALTPVPSEAERKSKKIRLGMTIEQLEAVLGVANRWPVDDDVGRLELGWHFDDGSYLGLFFEDRQHLTAIVVDLPRDLTWYVRLRDRLRKAGLPI